MAVHFGGSRSLPSSPLLRQVVQAVIQSGQAVHVGCAVGADQQVIQAVKPSFLVVFAQFASSGAGSFSGSAVLSVQVAAQAGARVFWGAGGPSFGPQALPLKARLMRRSRAALAGCSCSVFFLAQASSSGSLAVAGCAVKAGQPVFAFCPVMPLAPRGCAGRWQPGSFVGFACWQWQPAAVQQSLF